MNIGNTCAGIYSVIPDARNDGMSICEIMTNSGNGCVCVYREFLLEAELAVATTQATERTLKT